MSRHRPPSSPVRRAVVAGVALTGLTVLAAHQFAFDGTKSVASELPRATAEGRSERTLLPMPTPTMEPTDVAPVPSPSPTAGVEASPSPSARRSDPPRGEVSARSEPPRPASVETSEPPAPAPAPPVGDGPADVAGAEPPAVAPQPTVVPDPTVALGVPEIINRERLAHGCGPIALDPTLGAYAEAILTGEAVYEELGAELMASGYDTAVEAVAAWMDDDESRADILHCDRTVIGVASADGDWILVMA